MDTRLLQEHHLPSQCVSESRNEPPFACFNFMGLPEELRDSVYGFALTQPDPISLQTHQGLQSDSDPSSVPDSISQAPPGNLSDTSNLSNVTKSSPDTSATRRNLNLAILRVSKAVYNEARPVLYSRNTFTTSIGDAVRALRLLMSSRNFVRCLRLEFSNSQDLLTRFLSLTQNYLRYFRGLEDLVLAFPEELPAKDWELLPGQNILCDEPSFSSELAAENLVRAIDWLPISTKVTIVGTNFGQGIVSERKEGAKDQVIEAAVQRVILNRIL